MRAPIRTLWATRGASGQTGPPPCRSGTPATSPSLEWASPCRSDRTDDDSVQMRFARGSPPSAFSRRAPPGRGREGGRSSARGDDRETAAPDAERRPRSSTKRSCTPELLLEVLRGEILAARFVEVRVGERRRRLELRAEEPLPEARRAELPRLDASREERREVGE